MDQQREARGSPLPPPSCHVLCAVTIAFTRFPQCGQGWPWHRGWGRVRTPCVSSEQPRVGSRGACWPPGQRHCPPWVLASAPPHRPCLGLVALHCAPGTKTAELRVSGRDQSLLSVLPMNVKDFYSQDGTHTLLPNIHSDSQPGPAESPAFVGHPCGRSLASGCCVRTNMSTLSFH